MMIVERVNASLLPELDQIYPLISNYDLIKYAKMFYYDMLAVLSNQHSSLPAILNPIHRIVPSPGFGVAVSIGGTNGYVSAFRISDKGVIKFLNRRPFSLPQESTKDDLFHLIVQNILAVTKGRKKNFPIGIGFAYPLKPLIVHRFLDGELMYMAKGRNIAGLVGKKIGQEFHKFLIREYKIDTTVVVANDAICLLLGGEEADIAGIVGTGLNFAYWEKRQNIAPLKMVNLHRFSQNEVAVNLESNNFDKIKGTVLRDKVDKLSEDRGYSLAEKEVSGAYLYQIFNAGKDKIVSRNFPDIVSTDQLNDMLTGAYVFSSSITPKEREKARLFAQRIFHRSAQIAAIELSGILMKLNKIKGIVPIVMEGGIFWKAQNYTSLMNQYINNILPEVIPSFARLFGSSRRGIAILATSTF